MLQILKGWIISWIRLGYPLFPLGNQDWIQETIPAGQAAVVVAASSLFPLGAAVVVAASSLFPLGRLHAVPHQLEGEFHRRMRKQLVGRGVLGTMLAILVLLYLSANFTGYDGYDDATMLMALISITFTLGVAGPLWTHAFRVRKFVRTEMTLVHTTSEFAWKFRAFYFSLLGMLMLYGMARGLIEGLTERSVGKEAGEVTSEATDALEKTLAELVCAPLSPLKALGIAALKALGGLFISASGAVAVVWLSLASRAFRDTGFVYGLFVLSLVSGFLWGYWYYIRKERAIAAVHADNA